MPVLVSLRKPLVRGIVASLAGVVVLLLIWRLLGRPVPWSSLEPAPLPLVMAASGAVVFLAARAWRFWLLLPEQRGQPAAVAGVTGTGWVAGLLLPGPSADVAFVATARRTLGVSIARGSGTSILARLLDLASVALVAALAATVSAAEPAAVLILSGLVALGGLVVLLAMFMHRPRRALLTVVGRIPCLSGLAARADSAMAEMSSGRLAAGLLTSTAACRIATAVQYAGLMSVVGLHLGFWQTWFALSLRTLLFTVPIQGIAGIGTSQAWWTSALALEGVPLGTAVAASVTLQALDLAISLPTAAATSLLVLTARRPSPSRKLAAATSDARLPVGSLVTSVVPQTQQIDGR